uniref:Carboxypeptidase regulatory-like domain-containing protein n=1 Tax=uncultured microorganism TaxID=358574 RepID=F8UGX1_9ZZZZ|nr:hypothetical protein LDC_03682 [uncultured microorganism]
MKKTLIILMTAILPIFYYCKTSPSSAENGGGTDQGNAMATGSVYTQDGKPAANAKIRIIRADAMPQTPEIPESTETDIDGLYGLTGLAEGTYNILIEKQGKMAYHDSVVISSTINILSPDTIKDPGSLTGVVRMVGSDNSKTVLMFVIGTDRWIVPKDSIGNFTLSYMAEGTYNVRILSTLDTYTPLDTKFRIRAGINDTLRDTIRLGYTGIPLVTGLTAAYDTAAGNIRLAWDPVDTSLIDGYILFRFTPNNLYVPEIKNEIPMKNNHAIDIIYMDQSYDSSEYTYTYKIKAQGKGTDKLSDYFSAPVTVTTIPPYVLYTNFKFYMPRYAPYGKIHVNDTMSLMGKFSNKCRTITYAGWSLDSLNNSCSNYIRRKEVSAKSGADTVKFTSAAAGYRRIFFWTKDQAGLVCFRSISIAFTKPRE